MEKTYVPLRWKVMSESRRARSFFLPMLPGSDRVGTADGNPNTSTWSLPLLKSVYVKDLGGPPKN